MLHVYFGTSVTVCGGQRAVEQGTGKSAFRGKTCCGSWSLWSGICCGGNLTCIEVKGVDLDNNSAGVVDKANDVCRLVAKKDSEVEVFNVGGRANEDKDVQKVLC